MKEETGMTIFGVAACILAGFLLFTIRGCSRDSDQSRNDRERIERQQMIDAGYEKRQVPTRFDEEWIKKETK